MGFGAYASIADLKGVLGITSTTDDTVMRKILESASRSIDKYCNRIFFTQTATKYFDGGSKLWLPDLLSITTLKTDEDGDATFENTLTATDYILYGGGIEDSLNKLPYTRIEISEDSNYSSFASGIRKGVQIVGVFGYGDGISATPYITDTTITEDLTAGELAIDVTSVTNLSAGQLILIGTEQYYIYSIATLTLTVEAGVNGTTQATHSSGATISIYQYPSDIRQACIDLSVALYQNRSKQGLQSERLGDYAYNMISPYAVGGRMKNIKQSILDDSLFAYKRLRF